MVDFIFVKNRIKLYLIAESTDFKSYNIPFWKLIEKLYSFWLNNN